MGGNEKLAAELARELVALMSKAVTSSNRKASDMSGNEKLIMLAAGRENISLSYLQKLRDIGATVSLRIDYKGVASRRIRGWPMRSNKPWHIVYGDGTLCCAFATLAQLERNLRARAGC